MKKYITSPIQLKYNKIYNEGDCRDLRYKGKYNDCLWTFNEVEFNEIGHCIVVEKLLLTRAEVCQLSYFE